MTKYQLVPYVVRLNVRGKASEDRPLSDIDAKGTNFADELSALLATHLGKVMRQTDTKSVRPYKLQFVEATRGDHHVFFAVAPGRSGIESEIRRPDGTALKRNFEDDEHVTLRHVVMYRPGSHQGILLAERVGGEGAATALRTFLTQTWRERYPDLVLTILPAADEHIWESALIKRPVVKYQIARTKTVDGKLALSGKPADFVLDVMPPGRGERWSLKQARKKAAKDDVPLKQVLLQEVAPVLAPGYKDPVEGAAALFDEGWSVAVQLELESGQKPVVQVETNASVTLTFPIIDGMEEPTSRPEDAAVGKAAKRLVGSGVFDRWDLDKVHATGLSWAGRACDDDGKPWKVVWDVVDQLGPSHPAEDDGS